MAQRRGVDSDLELDLEGSLTEAPLDAEEEEEEQGPAAAQEQLAQPPVPAFLVEEQAISKAISGDLERSKQK